MNVDWRANIKPVSQSSKFKKGPGPSTLTPAQRCAAKMDTDLANFKAKVELKRPTITEKDGEVKFVIRFAAKSLKLSGEETVFVVDAGKFESTYIAIKEAVLAGEFDDQLNEFDAAMKERTSTMVSSRMANKAAKSELEPVKPARKMAR